MDSFAIGCVVHRGFEAETVGSIIALSQSTNGCRWQLAIGADVSVGRNQLALGCKEDYLLVFDSDMVFTPHDVKALADSLESSPEYGAISALYYKRDGSDLPVCNWHNVSTEGWMGDRERVKKAKRFKRKRRPAEVDSFGGGLLLIDRRSLDKLEYPYFEDRYEETGYIDSDTGFCKKLKQAGYQPSVHFGVKVGHVGTTTY